MIESAIKRYLAESQLKTFNIKGIMFDMDGVLFDSMPLHAEAWVKTFESIGIPFTKRQVYLNEGRTGAATIDDEFQKHFGRHSTTSEQQEIYHIKSGIFKQMPKPGPIPGIADVLQFLAGNNIARTVVTGSGESSTLDRIEMHFPNIFNRRLMVTANDVKQGKPYPEPYLMGLQKLGLEPNEALIVENAPMGIQAGVAAGVFTIGVNTGILTKKDLENAGADLVLDNMQQLLATLQTMIRRQTA